MATHHVLITGATGFIGRTLIAKLLARHHRVTAFIRRGSEGKLPPGCTVLVGDPLQKGSFANRVKPADTFVHLVGIAHPSPFKPNEFRDVDLASIRIAAKVAQEEGLQHFVYLSVASPLPVMQDYVNARLEGEALLKASGMNATFVKPFYVLGPGRRWPMFLLPVFWVLERFPPTRQAARRVGFVTIDQIANAMVRSIENPPQGIRVLDVPAIKAS
jgi:uncharacterized protein YbjT (DUF2867 family)